MGLSQRREKLIARLRVPKTRAREAAVLVEGVRAVQEALDAGVEVSYAVVSPRLAQSPVGIALEGRLADCEVVRVGEADVSRLSDTQRDQGVLLVCREPAAALSDLHADGRYLLLDGVQDPGNAGTLVRSAVAFGLDAVICLDGTVDPWGPKPVRASAGLVFRLPIVREDAEPVIARLKDLGVPLYVADTKGDDLEMHSEATSFALALGNEGRGVRPLVRREAARSLGVRMAGDAESLNVAVAGSILLHSLTRGASGE